MHKSITIFLCIAFIILEHQFCKAQCHADDWTALKALYESTKGDNWQNNTNWNNVVYATNPSNCSLNNVFGVEVNAFGRVNLVDLSNNNLNGEIPIQIGNLKLIKDLRLNNNLLGGSIPIEMGGLNNIENLNLSDNRLTGNIPVEFGNLNKLFSLHLNKNKLRGEIPKSFANLNNLVLLSVRTNQLIGEIPKELSQLTKLEYLDFGVNFLIGEIPSSLGNLAQLEFLLLDQNNLIGYLPASLGSLTLLMQLSLSGNNLSGTIPGEFGNLNNIGSLDLSLNQLSGCYPPNLNALCSKPVTFQITQGNSFNASWEDFCASNAGICEEIKQAVVVSTNYSGNVSILLDNTQNILSNNVATIYNYNTCSDYTNIANCSPVVGFNNFAANEAIWAVTMAAEFLSTFQITIPPVNIIVNNTENINSAKFYATYNTINLGKGDGIERSSMTAPDIVGHEYAHAIIRAINNLGNYKISGALNESYADIFGELVEQYCYENNNNWIYGTQVMINPPNGIRSLVNPKDATMQYQLPDTYKGEHWIHIDNACFHIDNCGIHTNSGVHSHWFYLLANGGSGINDYGYTFNVNGIGVDKATAILFDNLLNNLNPQSTFLEVRDGSIRVTQSLYPNQSATISSARQAWDAVGVFEPIDNPIEFRITNASQTDPVSIQASGTVLPIEFDLNIDSLGLDITADELCFTLHLPPNYRDINLKGAYQPLTVQELTVSETDGEMSICINRQNQGSGKRSENFALIASKSSIIQFGVCIVSEILKGESATIEPIVISGYTKTGFDEIISFKSTTLPFGFDYEDITNNPQNLLETSLTLNHKNCIALGTIAIEVLNNYVIGLPPYTYSLSDERDIILQQIEISSPIHQFYGLEVGTYRLKVEDSTDKQITKKFSISFISEPDGSVCCPENLTIPPGAVNGMFNATSTISFTNGSLISEGQFEICD